MYNYLKNRMHFFPQDIAWRCSPAMQQNHHRKYTSLTSSQCLAHSKDLRTTTIITMREPFMEYTNQPWGSCNIIQCPPTARPCCLHWGYKEWQTQCLSSRSLQGRGLQENQQLWDNVINQEAKEVGGMGSESEMRWEGLDPVLVMYWCLTNYHRLCSL